MVNAVNAPTACVLQVHDPSLGRTVQLGKFCQTPQGIWVYRLDPAPSGRIRLFDGWGVAPCVLDAMAERGIDLIHLHVKGEPHVLEVSRADVLCFGILREFAGRKVKHYHVPAVYWRRISDYRTSWITQVLTLRWVDPEPVRPQSQIPEQPVLL